MKLVIHPNILMAIKIIPLWHNFCLVVQVYYIEHLNMSSVCKIAGNSKSWRKYRVYIKCEHSATPGGSNKNLNQFIGQ